MSTTGAPGLIHFPHPPSWYIGQELAITSTTKLWVIIGAICLLGLAGRFVLRNDGHFSEHHGRHRPVGSRVLRGDRGRMVRVR